MAGKILRITIIITVLCAFVFPYFPVVFGRRISPIAILLVINLLLTAFCFVKGGKIDLSIPRPFLFLIIILLLTFFISNLTNSGKLVNSLKNLQPIISGLLFAVFVSLLDSKLLKTTLVVLTVFLFISSLLGIVQFYFAEHNIVTTEKKKCPIYE